MKVALWQHSVEIFTQGCSAQAASENVITHSHMCATAQLSVSVCVRSVPLYCWWLGFRIVSRLSVINVPE